MIIVYAPAGFEQSCLDAAAMPRAGGRILLERYGLTRGQLPASSSSDRSGQGGLAELPLEPH